MTSTEQKGICTDRVRNASRVNVENLECAICHDLLYKLVACQSCETPFCSACINRWLVNNSNKCSNRCVPYTERKCPSFIAKLLAELQITCYYQSKGSQEVRTKWMHHAHYILLSRFGSFCMEHLINMRSIVVFNVNNVLVVGHKYWRKFLMIT